MIGLRLSDKKQPTQQKLTQDINIRKQQNQSHIYTTAIPTEIHYTQAETKLYTHTHTQLSTPL